IGLAGYALGERTLVAGLHHLRAGEMALITGDHEPAYSSYAVYRPWRAVERPHAQLIDDLGDVLRNVFSKMIASAQGRPIVVPLSAGFDSRLIAAALKELRYPDVRCYAYGIP